MQIHCYQVSLSVFFFLYPSSKQIHEQWFQGMGRRLRMFIGKALLLHPKSHNCVLPTHYGSLCSGYFCVNKKELGIFEDFLRLCVTKETILFEMTLLETNMLKMT